MRKAFSLVAGVCLLCVAGCGGGGDSEEDVAATTTTTTTTAAATSDGAEHAQVVSVTPGANQSFAVHIRISNPAGISSYAVWSISYELADPVEEVFSQPLPTSIDKTVTAVVRPAMTDPAHTSEFGLHVTLPDHADPIFVYGSPSE